MPVYRNIDDFTAGDTYSIVRSVNAASNGIDTVSDAWFTVKTSLADNDAMARFQIHITQAPTGSGVVTINADRSATLTFISSVSASYNIQPLETLFYDIKVKMLPTGYIYRPEEGKLFTSAGVTTLPSS